MNDVAGRPLMIEFLGLPGAGKTAVARHVARRLRAEGRTVHFSRDVMKDDAAFWSRTLQRLGLVLSEAPHNLHMYLRAARFVRHGCLGPIDFAKALWNFWSVLAMLSRYRRSGSGILILDQGILQGVWTARYPRRVPRSIDGWSELVSEHSVTRCLFVCVHVDWEVARARLRKRARVTSSMQWENRICDTDLWNRCALLINELVDGVQAECEAATRHPGAIDHVVSVRSTVETTPDELASGVVNDFKRRFHGHEAAKHPTGQSSLALREGEISRAGTVAASSTEKHG